MDIVTNKPTITRKELESVLDCLIKDQLTTGNPVKTFEAAIADLVNMKYALATQSVTAAYHLLFNSLNLQEGDEIIIPSFFSSAPLSALSLTRGKAVLVDNEEKLLFPSVEQIQEKITDNTKAIIIGHMFGFHFNVTPLKKFNIPIIEDISHAIGTSTNDIPVGHDSNFTVASFAPSMMITTGNGGIICTNNSKQFSHMRDFRGSGDDTLNYEYSMCDLHGAMGISQMLKLKDFLKRRRDIAKIYYAALKLTPHESYILYNEEFAYQTFPVIFDAPKDKIERYWKKKGIEICRPIISPLHSILNLRGLDYPNCDRQAKKIYALPLYPTLTKKNIDKVSKTLSSFI